MPVSAIEKGRTNFGEYKGRKKTKTRIIKRDLIIPAMTILLVCGMSRAGETVDNWIIEKQKMVRSEGKSLIPEYGSEPNKGSVRRYNLLFAF